MQDAIERALRWQNRPEPLDEMRRWMFRVIRNLQYDELRKRRVRREYFTAERRFLDAMGSSPDIARDVMVRLASQKLSPDKREVLFLVDVLGLKYVETATVMDVLVGTVMSRVSRARMSLMVLINGSSETASKAARKT